jgi:steroid 5-alpha reductase family enzyme
MNELILTFLLSLGIQIVLFIPAFIFKTDKLTDLSYGMTFIIMALIVFFANKFHWSKLLLLLMIAAWGLRLAIYLVIRIFKIKKDKRFDGIREKFFKFISFWILQGVSVWIIVLPAMLFMTQTPKITILSFIGLAIWIIGISTEAIADAQKYSFNQNPKNKGKWIGSGLWKYSRHPNYLGEITCWVGIYLFAFSSLSTLYRIISLVSPIYIAFIIIFVTGIPKLEKYADEKWGKDKKYLAYKKRTSILLILPVKKA